ncbi:UNVERIFIED_CONTAM: hypothetical protein HDU68_011103 [Siphonaria sp. JEL0065]|nr:hypothetical protein HDU68_011103 [Siphonaria sp. JEL0065]
MISARCGQTELAPKKLHEVEASFQDYYGGNFSSFGFAIASVITVPVYFHVISQGSGYQNGELSDSMIQKQLQVLNADYTGQVKFTLAGTTHTKNPSWFVAAPDTNAYKSMKNSLRKGGAETLNVYSTKLPNGLLGIATFPSDFKSNSKMDGVVVHFGSFPGGSLPRFNLGKTTTHEVGHWLGLYHTFQGGCSGSGDYVSDTPAEASPASGCPANRDSCTSSGFPGIDPIHNYMDYSDDSCMNQFTPGQYSRIQAQYLMYRNTGNPGPKPTTTRKKVPILTKTKKVKPKTTKKSRSTAAPGN